MAISSTCSLSQAESSDGVKNLLSSFDSKEKGRALLLFLSEHSDVFNNNSARSSSDPEMVLNYVSMIFLHEVLLLVLLLLVQLHQNFFPLLHRLYDHIIIRCTFFFSVAGMIIVVISDFAAVTVVAAGVVAETSSNKVTTFAS